MAMSATSAALRSGKGCVNGAREPEGVTFEGRCEQELRKVGREGTRHCCETVDSGQRAQMCTYIKKKCMKKKAMYLDGRSKEGGITRSRGAQ
jgi:hypothetical protein